MEELTVEKLKEELLKDKTPEYNKLIEEKILNNNNISVETRKLYNLLIFNNYHLMCLNRNDINCIMNLCHTLELEIIKDVKNDPEILYLLNFLRMELNLKLHRALFIRESINIDLISWIKSIFNKNKEI